jgi:uncharacterized protein YbjT (DUF2867 family)
MSRHVIVLGGTGFVGRHLAAQLVDAGHRVTVLSRGVDAHARARLPAGVEIDEGNVHEPAFLRASFEGADAVVNLVGILNERGDAGDDFEHVYVDLLDSVLAAMRASGVKRLLQMSALNAGRGDSHYLLARGRAEQHLRASDIDWTVFRPSVIAGPGDGLFCRFDQLLAYTPVLPIGRADARFQPVWVEDVAAAFVHALNDPATRFRSYDLVGPDTLTLAEIVRLTAEARGRHRAVIALPHTLGRLQAEVGEHLPGKPISRDNWRSLQLDSTSTSDGLAKLGITATPVLPRVREILTRADA